MRLPTTYGTIRPPRDYGRGRLGECGHVLCRYNVGPDCWPCQYTRNRLRSSASALGEAEPDAALAAWASEEA